MKHTGSQSPVSFFANVARLPQKGLPVVIEADAAQRAALADEHGLLSVEAYRAELLVASWKRNGVKVSGRYLAGLHRHARSRRGAYRRAGRGAVAPRGLQAWTAGV